ncbi:hypothetical protein DL96DRAFT_557017 [Flagelloscypha sp. PMI_526]|nr:hypothetical protein DL96DRAFT_557017 [Flagelloscypha sp. PMI_526]
MTLQLDGLFHSTGTDLLLLVPTRKAMVRWMAEAVRRILFFRGRGTWMFPIPKSLRRALDMLLVSCFRLMLTSTSTKGWQAKMRATRIKEARSLWIGCCVWVQQYLPKHALANRYASKWFSSLCLFLRLIPICKFRSYFIATAATKTTLTHFQTGLLHSLRPLLFLSLLLLLAFSIPQSERLLSGFAEPPTIVSRTSVDSTRSSTRHQFLIHSVIRSPRASFSTAPSPSTFSRHQLPVIGLAILWL